MSPGLSPNDWQEVNPKPPDFPSSPKRVVSLVPSYTESLFDLGLGDRLVGITDYCIYPEKGTAGKKRLGGPRNPVIQEILGLSPDLVLANWEENTEKTVRTLREAGIPVWVTFPQTVCELMDILSRLAVLFESEYAARWIESLEGNLVRTIESAQQQRSMCYFYPIWYDKHPIGKHWWMTFNRGTYSHDLLQLLGCINVFSDRDRRYPLEADLGIYPSKPSQRDVRYPRVTAEEIQSAAPELILLPDEPYVFGKDHLDLMLDLFKDVPAVRKRCILQFDGTLINWPGIRLAKALEDLPKLLDTFRSH